MIIRYNGVESGLYENLAPDHRNEILKYFDPTQPEKLIGMYNQAFLVNPSNPNNEPWSGDEVLVSEFQKVPMLVHLDSLTDLTYYVLPKSQVGTPGNTDNLCVGLYRRLIGGSTTIVPNIILDDPLNTRSIVGLTNSFYDFIKSKTMEILTRKANSVEEEQKQLVDRLLLSTMKYGFVFDITKTQGSANVKISYSPTGELVADRTFTTFD